MIKEHRIRVEVNEGKQTLTEILDMTVKDPSIDKEEKAKIILHATSLICGIIAAQPLPFADIFILTPIQLVMVTYLNKIKGNPYQQSEAKEILSSLLGVVGWGVLAQHMILGLYKSVIPFMGAITTIPLVYGATFALGKCAETLIEAKVKGQTIREEELKKISKQAKKKAQKEQDNMTFSDAMKKLKNLKENSQEYKQYIDYIQSHSIPHLLNRIENEEGKFSSNNINELLKQQMECFKERIESKYSRIRISEDALFVISLFPSKIILEEIEPVIAQLNYNLAELSNLKIKQQNEMTKIEINANFGTMQVSSKDTIYEIQTVEPAEKYKTDKVLNSILDSRNNQQELLYDSEIRVKFHEMLSNAQHEILIVSPWVSNSVTKQILPILKEAVTRGVTIKIIYGMSAIEKLRERTWLKDWEQQIIREKNSDKNIRYYKRELGKALQVKRIETHTKLCICDNAYLTGSYNFLSFSGEYKTDIRQESCTYGRSMQMIQEWKRKFFDEM